MFKDIKEQFKEVIAFSQDFDPQVDELFERWMEAKRDIIEAFGGKLIYEVPVPVHFHLDEKERTRSFNEFIDHVSRVYYNDELVKFLLSNGSTNFFDNTNTIAYEDKGIKIPAGMKLIKAFKFFEKDQKLLADLQNCASRIIQEDKIEGTLCFSVHPLDYLSSSCNTYKWRSCHALDGEFRAGNLSYMVDKSTIICYLKGADNVVLPCFPESVPWNSKKWRVLFFLSEKWDMIFAGRQYPFATEAGLDIVREYLLKALKLSTERFDTWHNDYVTKLMLASGTEPYTLTHPYVPVRHELFPIDQMVIDGKNSLHFNDLLNSSTYKDPYYCIQDNTWWWGEGMPRFEIGQEVKCLHCAKNRIIDSEIMVCRDCAEKLNLFEDDHPVCECCGDTIYDDDYLYVQGEIICPSCADEHCFYCEQCNEWHFIENQTYDKQLGEYVCYGCYNRRKDR